MSEYSRKHPPETRPDPALVDAIEEVVDEGCVSCAVAHELAEDMGVTPAEIGKNLDLLEYRIVKCQMGIFGFMPEKKILKPAESITDELKAHLENAARDGQVSCAACWQIARSLGLQKMAVAAACETMRIQIKPCQLGAF